LNQDGTINNGITFGSGFDNVTLTATFDLNNNILVGGGFTSYNGSAQGRIVRFLDPTVPILSSVTLTSSNANPNLATTGDTVTLTYTVDDTPTSQIVTIGGQAVTPTCTGTSPTIVCTAQLTITATVPTNDGILPFTISTTSVGGTTNVSTNSTVVVSRGGGAVILIGGGGGGGGGDLVATIRTIPQANDLFALLRKGIGYHHSGILPVLKEIVELLFERGLVRLLFATETFAVGLNMPTKTVVFTSFKKMDDLGSGAGAGAGGASFRNLRTDEYTQMAGRAGRRGKDTEGNVIYLPLDNSPAIHTTEMARMLTGTQPVFNSRLTLHYSIILKIIGNTSLSINEFIEKSYWYLQMKNAIRSMKNNIDKTRAVIAGLISEISPAIQDDCFKREQIEKELKLCEKGSGLFKENQKKLERLKNTAFMGPAYKKAWESWHVIREHEQTVCEMEAELTMYDYRELLRIKFNLLSHCGFIQKHGAGAGAEVGAGAGAERMVLTRKGIIATEINESHPFIISELFMSADHQTILNNLLPSELPVILAVCLTDKLKPIRDDIYVPTKISELHVSVGIKTVLNIIEHIRVNFETQERRCCEKYTYAEDGWTLSLDYCECIHEWITDPEMHISYLCDKYGIFEGGFVRIISKLNNMIDEWEAIATLESRPLQMELAQHAKKLLNEHSGGVRVDNSLYIK
jgi:superfamily II RNA helicase